jgi:tetratricopeptide (TPR) repeat protein
MLTERGHTDEALQILRQHAEPNGHGVYAQTQLVQRLRELGRWDELRERANAGDASAAPQLVSHDGISALRKLADAGNKFAAWHLAKALIEDDRDSEAIPILAKLADNGDEYAAEKAATLLTQQGRTDEALQILRKVAHADKPHALRAFLDLLLDLNLEDELKEAAKNGDPAFMMR